MWVLFYRKKREEEIEREAAYFQAVRFGTCVFVNFFVVAIFTLPFTPQNPSCSKSAAIKINENRKHISTSINRQCYIQHIIMDGRTQTCTAVKLCTINKKHCVTQQRPNRIASIRLCAVLYEHKSNITKNYCKQQTVPIYYYTPSNGWMPFVIAYLIISFFPHISLSLFLSFVPSECVRVILFLFQYFLSSFPKRFHECVQRVNHICAWCCLPNTKFQPELVRLCCHSVLCDVLFDFMIAVMTRPNVPKRENVWLSLPKPKQQNTFGCFQRLYFYLCLASLFRFSLHSITQFVLGPFSGAAKNP